MYTDIVQWERVRNLVLHKGQSPVEVSKAEKISFRTLQKMLLYDKPPGFRYSKGAQKGRPKEYNGILDKLLAENQRLPERSRLTTTEIFHEAQIHGFEGSFRAVTYHRRLYEDADEAHLWKSVQHIVRNLADDDGAIFLASLFSKGTLTGNNKTAAERRRKIHGKSAALARSQVSRESWVRAGWDRWISEIERTGQYDSKLISKEDTQYLLGMMVPEKKINRKKALALLALDQDWPVTYVAKFLDMSVRGICRYMDAYKRKGVTAPFFYNIRPKKDDDNAFKKMVFTLLHEPPALSGINRTSWRFDDLKRVLKEKGFPASYPVLHNVIKEAGYRWKSARTVLTSHDPNYKEKLAHVHNILSHLQDNEHFFSIDEFGPFSVKMCSGRMLSPPEVQRIVPQFQKSKGVLICTAALDLSYNQVTHFFSAEKNSVEMIKLAKVLVDKYPTAHRLYLSWDAASWHKSRRLLKFLDEHNATAAAAHLPLLA